MRRLSHSQIGTWTSCQYQWKLSYIDKLQVQQDWSYANGGSTVHKALEAYFNYPRTLLAITDPHDKVIELVKGVFEAQWKSFKLDEGFLKDKKTTYWLMVLNAIGKKIELTSVEMKIFAYSKNRRSRRKTIDRVQPWHGSLEVHNTYFHHFERNAIQNHLNCQLYLWVG